MAQGEPNSRQSSRRRERTGSVSIAHVLQGRARNYSGMAEDCYTRSLVFSSLPEHPDVPRQLLKFLDQRGSIANEAVTRIALAVGGRDLAHQIFIHIGW